MRLLVRVVGRAHCLLVPSTAILLRSEGLTTYLYADARLCL